MKCINILSGVLSSIALGAGSGAVAFPVDTEAPILHGVSISGDIAAGGTGQLRLQVSDDASGLAAYQNLCHHVARVDSPDVSVMGICGEYRALGGNVYSLEFSLSPWLAAGEYFVKDIFLSDNAGHSIAYEGTYQGNGNHDLLPNYIVKQPTKIVATNIPIFRFKIR